MSQSIAFGGVVSAMVRGEELEETLSSRLRGRVKSGELPFTHAVLAGVRSPSEA